ncbi:MAG: metallophosphoesterase family protein [Chloroflexota bacterium]
MDENSDAQIIVGVISDTHGHLSEQALNELAGVSLIIHAGDLDTLEVKQRLMELAPLDAVRGNMDRGPGLAELPRSEVSEVGGAMIYTIHDLAQLDLDPAAAGFQAVIYGHYHRPEVVERKGVLYLNPGSATFPRMGTSKSMARLYIRGGKIETELVNLE